MAGEPPGPGTAQLPAFPPQFASLDAGPSAARRAAFGAVFAAYGFLAAAALAVGPAYGVLGVSSTAAPRRRAIAEGDLGAFVSGRGERLGKPAAPASSTDGGGPEPFVPRRRRGSGRDVLSPFRPARPAAPGRVLRGVAYDLLPRGIRTSGATPGAARTEPLPLSSTDEIGTACWRPRPSAVRARRRTCRPPAASWITGQIPAAPRGVQGPD